MNGKPKAIGLPEVCERLGISYSHARHLIAEGRFPVPELKRISARAWHRFSEADVERYLASATADAERGAA